MTSANFVCDFGFDISFTSREEALEQQNQVSSFVSQRLVAVANEVFTRMAPEDVVSIDEIDVDLGVLPSYRRFEEAELRFRRELEEQLLRKLHGLRGTMDRPSESERTLTPLEKDFDVVLCWLERGYLPWNVKTLSRDALTELFRRVLAHSESRMVQRLRASHRKPEIAKRLSSYVARGIPAASEILEQAEMIDWRASIERAVTLGDENWFGQSWQKLFRDRPALVETVVREAGLRQEVRRAMAGGFSDPILHGIVTILEPQESGFIHEVTSRPEVFREAAEERSEGAEQIRVRLWEFTLTYLLKERGSEFNRRMFLANTVQRMAAHHNVAYEEMLESLTAVLARFGWSSELKTGMLSLLSDLQEQQSTLDRPAGLTQSDAEFVARIVETAEVVEPAIREFSKRYLAVEGGRRFNRAAYIDSLIRAAVEQRSLDRRGLIAALLAALSRPDVARGLETELIAILRELQEDWKEALRAAVVHGNTELVVRHWPLWSRMEKQQILSAVRQLAADAHSRSEVIRALPTGVLRDIAEMSDSAAASLMRELAERPELFAPALQTEQPSAIRRSLWEFTFIYALVERGTAFNRRSYAKSIIRQLAARYNVRHADLLESIRLVLMDSKLEARVSNELSTILLELAASEGLAAVRVESLAALIQNARRAERDHLLSQLDRFLAKPEPAFLRWVRKTVSDPEMLRELCGVLSDEQLVRILTLLDTSDAQKLLRLADVVLEAANLDHAALKWQFVFEYVLERRLPASPAAFAPRFVQYLATKSNSGSEAALRMRVARELRIHSNREYQRAAEALEPKRILPVIQRPKSKPLEILPEYIFIQNAGIVLAGPYLPRLFAMTGLLEDNQFRDDEAAWRAVYLLQYAADPVADPPEHVLALNKILCGFTPEEPPPGDIALTDKEKEAVEGLLKAMIAHWTIIGSTSVAGLRESFLQREGRLSFEKEAWHLLVEPRAFDMLLDRLPWSFKVTRYAWMKVPLYVEWR